MKWTGRILAGASIAMAGLGAALADEPAVANLNIQTTARAGVTDDEWRILGGLKGAFPLGQSFGAQIEGGIGNDGYAGAGAHLFWRDPNLALVGVFGAAETFDGLELFRAGAEAELYFGRFTVALRGGYQDAEGDGGAFGRADVTWFATPNLALRAGAEATGDIAFGRASLEWQPLFGDYPELSVHMRGEVGDDDRYSVLGGITIHLGADGVSLIDRERREDPPYAIFNELVLRDLQVRQAGGANAPPPPPEEEIPEEPFEDEPL